MLTFPGSEGIGVYSGLRGLEPPSGYRQGPGYWAARVLTRTSVHLPTYRSVGAAFLFGTAGKTFSFFYT